MPSIYAGGEPDVCTVRSTGLGLNKLFEAVTTRSDAMPLMHHLEWPLGGSCRRKKPTQPELFLAEQRWITLRWPGRLRGLASKTHSVSGTNPASR